MSSTTKQQVRSLLNVSVQFLFKTSQKAVMAIEDTCSDIQYDSVLTDDHTDVLYWGWVRSVRKASGVEKERRDRFTLTPGVVLRKAPARWDS